MGHSSLYYRPKQGPEIVIAYKNQQKTGEKAPQDTIHAFKMIFYHIIIFHIILLLLLFI